MDRGAGDRWPVAEEDRESVAESIGRLRRIMWDQVGLVRDEEGMGEALETFERLARRHHPLDHGIQNQLLVARLLATAARCRRESRGSHYRQDFPQTSPSWRKRLLVTLRPSASLLPEIEVRSFHSRAAVETSPLAVGGTG